MKRIFLIVIWLLLMGASAAPPTSSPDLTWSETETSITIDAGNPVGGFDGENPYFAVQNTGSAYEFYRMENNGSLTFISTIETGSFSSTSEPADLDYLGGDDWIFIYGESGNVRSAHSSDGGVTWNSDVLIATNPEADSIMGVFPVNAGRFQVYIEGVGVHESNDTANSWSDTGPVCIDSGGGGVPENFVVVGLYTVVKVSRGSTSGTPVSQSLLDCTVPSVLETFVVHQNVGAFARPSQIEAQDFMMIVQRTTDSGVAVIFSEGTTQSTATLYNSTEGDLTFNTVHDCTSFGAVYGCLIDDGDCGATPSGCVLELVYSLNAGSSWFRSRITDAAPSGGPFAISTDGSLFYVIGGEAGNLRTWISSELPEPPINNEVPEFETGLRAAMISLGFKSVESQLLFAIALIGLTVVGFSKLSSFIGEGKAKAWIPYIPSVFIGAFCVYFLILELWVFALGLVVSGTVMMNGGSVVNTYRALSKGVASDLAKSFDTRLPTFRRGRSGFQGDEAAPGDDGGPSGGSGDDAASGAGAGARTIDSRQGLKRIPMQLAEGIEAEIKQGQREVAEGSSRVKTEAFQRGEKVDDA